MKKNTYNLSFIIEGLTQEQADALFDIVIAFAEAFDATAGGGLELLEKEHPDGKD